MVLQQQTDVRVWGKATPHRIVSVRGDWMSVAVTTKVSVDSTWMLTVPTPAGTMQPHTLIVSEQGGDSVTLTDVLIGEVWLCSGQSNMEMPLNGFWNCPVNHANEEIATAGEWGRCIRMVTIPKTGATTPQESVRGQWCVP
jgi:sialate O-acetylesterase